MKTIHTRRAGLSFRNPAGIIASLLLLNLIAFANPGVTFLELSVGARESALGGAGAALITGPTSATYNPAAVAFTGRSVALMHQTQFADTRAQFIGFTVRYHDWALSPSFRGTRMSDIEYRTDPTRDPISLFDATNEAVGTAIAYRVSPRFSVGAAGKYLHQKILWESSEGWSVDAGAIARWEEMGLVAGMAVNHVGDMNQFLAEKPILPTTFRGGLSWDKAVGKIGHALITADALAIRDSAPQFVGGVEFRAPEYVALRVGFAEGREAQDLSLGFGLFIKHLQFDYAFIPYGENLGDGHRFSLGIEI